MVIPTEPRLPRLEGGWRPKKDRRARWAFVFSLVGWLLARVVGMDGSTSLGSTTGILGTLFSASVALGGTLLATRRGHKNAPPTSVAVRSRVTWLIELVAIVVAMWFLALLIVFFPEIAAGSL